MIMGEKTILEQKQLLFQRFKKKLDEDQAKFSFYIILKDPPERVALVFKSPPHNIQQTKGHNKHTQWAPPSFSLHHSCPFTTDRKKKKAKEERKSVLPEMSMSSRVLLCLCRRKHMYTLCGPGGHGRATRIHRGRREAKLPKTRPGRGLPGDPGQGEDMLGSCRQSWWGDASPERDHQHQRWRPSPVCLGRTPVRP